MWSAEALEKENAVKAGWIMTKASMVEAQRIAKLVKAHGGRYLDELWALVEYAPDESVRAFAYAQATHPGGS